MIQNFLSTVFVFSLAVVGVSAQTQATKKEGEALRIEAKPDIDGKLTESFWALASPMTQFTQQEPNPGVSATKETIVKMVYDDDAIYVGFEMFEPNTDSVLKELSPRDQIGNADWCAVIIDAYKDGNNGVGFVVTASGVQTDVKYSVFGEDETWNAIWQSEVFIGEGKWTAEIKIPYSSLRFPEVDIQQWHVNFIRYRRGNREKSTWNPINPAINGFLNQSGYINGIKGIKPPLRLQLFPYLSAYYNVSGRQQATSLNGGMDIKYGLNDAFTLDMTLIPDFGQVQSDNNVLNLSPFEVRFQENRQFFTEGTELFNKGDLFYSRRIGETPSGYFGVQGQLNEGDTLLENPSETRLLNATKVSGRTSSGLGIGVFNAVSRNTFARLRRASGEEEQILTEPLTNYNVLVLDQNLPNNSYVTLINTNVSRNGSFYDAGVTGVQYQLQDKKIRYQLEGFAALSQQYGKNGPGNDVFGSNHRMSIAKVSGNFTARAGYNLMTDRYDPNDLGFNLFNNIINKFVNVGFNQFKPVGIFNRFGINAFLDHTQIYNPRAFNNLGTGVSSFFILKTFDAFGVNFNTEPITTYDYFETRRFGRYYTFPVNHNVGGWISSDYRRRFALDITANYRVFDEPGRNRYNINFSPRFRVNNKLSFIYSWSYSDWKNDVGYAVPNATWFRDASNGELNGFPGGDAIIFGIRDQKTFTNLLTARYSFNNTMGLTFRLRHYWSKVRYDDVYELNQEGLLVSTPYTGRSVAGESYHDNSFNAFNIDMVYSWVFSPGSELRLVWKNSIFNSESIANRTFRNNLENVFDQSQTNSFSVRFLYFIDSQMLLKRRPKSQVG
ncbi:MAG TPA: DUF5916 domain-containing protein [Luteibaculaceae bacterium]|nr:DUF5916 domain-containing protein [Luteibaculaceae bacterium]